MSNTQNGFAYLKENLPLWIDSLAVIDKKVEGKQHEATRVPVPVAQVQKRTDSSESLQVQEENHGNNHLTIEITSAPQLQDICPPSYSLQQQVNIAKRKRRTASVLTGALSNPVKYRSRSMIVVYYDSEIQKWFETLVRNIGTGRNLLRKGKIAARMEAFAGGLEEDDSSGDDAESVTQPYSPKISMPAYRSARGRTPPDPLANSGTDMFDAADKELETAQSLCERAAHQFLRDGDCRDETKGAKARFEDVIKISDREVVKLKEKEEKAKAKAVRQAAREAARGAAREDVRVSIPSTPIAQNGAVDIEVDDDEDELEYMPPPTFRRMARR